MVQNPLLYANITALSSIGQELSPIKFLHCGNKEFGVFLLKIDKNITIFFYNDHSQMITI